MVIKISNARKDRTARDLDHQSTLLCNDAEEHVIPIGSDDHRWCFSSSTRKQFRSIVAQPYFIGAARAIPSVVGRDTKRRNNSCDSSTSCDAAKSRPAPEQPSLLDRLGGPAKLDKFTHAFIQAISEKDGLAHFFVNVPVATIRLHQRQLFQAVFGGGKEQDIIKHAAFSAPPSVEEHHQVPSCYKNNLLNFLIVTHSRLFRDLGLDGTHFDLVASCFVQAAQDLAMPPHLLDECLAIIGPLRVAFETGAALAAKDKEEQGEQFLLLVEEQKRERRTGCGQDNQFQQPKVPHRLEKLVGKEDLSATEDMTETTHDNLYQETKNEVKNGLRNKKGSRKSSSSSSSSAGSILAALPPPPPLWLLEKLQVLGGHQRQQGHIVTGCTDNGDQTHSTCNTSAPIVTKKNAAALIGPWTCALSNRFTVEDPVLSPIFMSMSYMELIPYLHALLQMAFSDFDKALPRNASKLLRMIRFPHGLLKPHAQLTQYKFARLMDRFTETAEELVPVDSLCNSVSGGAKRADHCTKTALILHAKENLTRIYKTVIMGHELVLYRSGSLRSSSLSLSLPGLRPRLTNSSLVHHQQREKRHQGLLPAATLEMSHNPSTQ
ncbi:hypothetical protein ACA910_002165 [Epithemia clementina (nom. ined.)]